VIGAAQAPANLGSKRRKNERRSQIPAGAESPTDPTPYTNWRPASHSASTAAFGCCAVGKGYLRWFDDGTHVTDRPAVSSHGTPVVEVTVSTPSPSTVLLTDCSRIAHRARETPRHEPAVDGRAQRADLRKRHEASLPHLVEHVLESTRNA
jgi:hypothetical protein